MKYYVYVHLKPDGSAFYVGKGNGNRAYSSRGRSLFWQRTVEKYPDYEIKIVMRDLSERDALDLERYLIAYYGRRNKGGTLCNLTDGGDGPTGYAYTPEQRRRYREQHAVRREVKDMYDTVIYDYLSTDPLWSSDYEGVYL